MKVVWSRRTSLCIMAIVTAYPLSAVPYAIIGILTDHPDGYEKAVLINVLKFWWLLGTTPMCLGFPMKDFATGAYINMYPYIIPTSIVLYWLYCWLHRKAVGE